MADTKKKCGSIIIFLAVLIMFPGAALALPPAVNEVKPEAPPKNKQIIILVVDGLQADSLNSGRTPNISGVGMAGVRADRVSAMPPDSTGARIYSLLCGTDPSDHGYAGDKVAPRRRTIMSFMEGRGIKTALIDGTGCMERAGGEASHKNFGPFGSDGEVVNAAVDLIRSKKPFLTVVVLSGPGRQLEDSGPGTNHYHAAVTAADNEVGRLLRQLHTDGTYESTLLIVTGTVGRPPLIIKGSDFYAGSKMPPVCLKDLAPTLGYLYGINLPEAKGLILWNALRPAGDRTENYMLFQRVRDLSAAYADVVDAAARLENEKILVQEEKVRLTRDKQSVEMEIEARENQIEKLNLIISAMKIAGLLGIILFVSALVVEYRILKKRYLFFT